TTDRSGPRPRSASRGRAGGVPASTATGGGARWERSCWNWSPAAHDGVDQSARGVLLGDDINAQSKLAGGLRGARADAGNADLIGHRPRHGIDKMPHG